jgi:hypothetical protein
MLEITPRSFMHGDSVWLHASQQRMIAALMLQTKKEQGILVWPSSSVGRLETVSLM